MEWFNKKVVETTVLIIAILAIFTFTVDAISGGFGDGDDLGALPYPGAAQLADIGAASVGNALVIASDGVTTEWGTVAGGGGGSGFWSTSTDDLVLYNNTASAVVVEATATTVDGVAFEVNGLAAFDGFISQASSTLSTTTIDSDLHALVFTGDPLTSTLTGGISMQAETNNTKQSIRWVDDEGNNMCYITTHEHNIDQPHFSVECAQSKGAGPDSVLTVDGYCDGSASSTCGVDVTSGHNFYVTSGEARFGGTVYTDAGVSLGVGTATPESLVTVARDGNVPTLTLRQTATAINSASNNWLGCYGLAGNDKPDGELGMGAVICGYASTFWNGTTNDYPTDVHLAVTPDGAGAMATSTIWASDGTIDLPQYDCSGNANGGVLTVDGSGNVTCDDDDSSAGGGDPFAWDTTGIGVSTSTLLEFTAGYVSRASSTVDGHITVNNRVIHAGDTDTYMQYATDQIQFWGGAELVAFANGSGGEFVINDLASTNSFRVESSSPVNTQAFHVDGTSGLTSINQGFVSQASSSLAATFTISADGDLVCTECIGANDVQAELKTETFTVSIASSTLSTTTSAAQHKLPNNITVTRVSCNTVGDTAANAGTTTVQFDERSESTPNTAGTDVLNQAIDCGFTASSTTSFNNSAITADNVLNFSVDTTDDQSGGTSPSLISLYVEYTIDD